MAAPFGLCAEMCEVAWGVYLVWFAIGLIIWTLSVCDVSLTIDCVDRRFEWFLGVTLGAGM